MRQPPTYDTPAAAEQAFYAAMSSGDLEAMMAVWTDGEDAVCVHPGGPRLVGSDAVRASFGEIFENGTVQVEPTAVRAFRNGDVAVHNVVEQIAVAGQHGIEIVSVVATNVYVKSGYGWLMMLHHAAAADDDSDDDADRPVGPLH
jgi:uncharacterized protein (TIGR02246 family)